MKVSHWTERRFNLAGVIHPASLVVMTLLMAAHAAAIQVEGVDFTDPVVIDAQAATDLILTTTKDVYVYVPNGLWADTVTLDGFEIIFTTGTTVDINNPLLCASGCPLDAFELTDDVLLNVLEPVGNLDVQAAGRIVVSHQPIPEPSTALLLALGLVGLAARQKRAGTRLAPVDRNAGG